MLELSTNPLKQVYLSHKESLFKSYDINMTMFSKIIFLFIFQRAECYYIHRQGTALHL